MFRFCVWWVLVTTVFAWLFVGSWFGWLVGFNSVVLTCIYLLGVVWLFLYLVVCFGDCLLFCWFELGSLLV